MPKPATTVARELYFALVTEARQWDGNDELLAGADDLPPTEVLDLIVQHTMLPTELFDAALAALIALDPVSYLPGAVSEPDKPAAAASPHHASPDPTTSSEPDPINPVAPIGDRAHAVDSARARAQAFVWGFQYAHGLTEIGTVLATQFATDYAAGVAEFLAGHRAILPPLSHAFSAWRAGNDIAVAPPTLSPRNPAPQQITDHDAFTDAMQVPVTELMWAAARGYGFGWCDASGLSAGSVDDFAAAVAVWFAERQRDPRIDRAWRAWRTGRDLATALTPEPVPPSGSHA